MRLPLRVAAWARAPAGGMCPPPASQAWLCSSRDSGPCRLWDPASRRPLCVPPCLRPTGTPGPGKSEDFVLHRTFLWPPFLSSTSLIPRMSFTCVFYIIIIIIILRTDGCPWVWHAAPTVCKVTLECSLSGGAGGAGALSGASGEDFWPGAPFCGGHLFPLPFLVRVVQESQGPAVTWSPAQLPRDKPPDPLWERDPGDDFLSPKWRGPGNTQGETP